MKRLIPYLAFVGGLAVLAVLIPRFNVVQPRVHITRAEAQKTMELVRPATGLR